MTGPLKIPSITGHLTHRVDSIYMAKERKEDQILSLFNQATAVLIALPFQPTTDAIASGLALLAVCEKLQKRAKIVSYNFQLPINHGFLPKSDEIFDDISSLKKFIISLDLAKASVEELSYEIQDGHLNIFITPKEGNFTATDVKTSDSDYAFDLVITLDAKDLESLGQLYEKNAEFFYSTLVGDKKLLESFTTFMLLDKCEDCCTKYELYKKIYAELNKCTTC